MCPRTTPVQTGVSRGMLRGPNEPACPPGGKPVRTCMDTCVVRALLDRVTVASGVSPGGYRLFRRWHRGQKNVERWAWTRRTISALPHCVHRSPARWYTRWRFWKAAEITKPRGEADRAEGRLRAPHVADAAADDRLDAPPHGLDFRKLRHRVPLPDPSSLLPASLPPRS